jgi:xanthine/CO dehydrogenase XdhC/CoxF family maturation factor
MTEISAILSALANAPHEAAALATLVEIQGSSYRRPGARLHLLDGGLRIGSISGGCLEDDILLRAQNVLQNGRSEIATYDTTKENDIVWGVGLGCQGVIRVFIERIPTIRPPWLSVLAGNLKARRRTELSVVHSDQGGALQGTQLTDEMNSSTASAKAFIEVVVPPPPLVLFGAGDDARPLVRLAKEVGWHVTVVDSRSAYATRWRFPEADTIIVTRPERLTEQLDLDVACYTVIMTHRYAEDLDLLRILLARQTAYIGVLGPRKRTERLLAQLRQEGFVADPEMGILERLFAPVGLDLGATTPETIALSILAEMQGLLTRRTPIHLRDRTAPIHA